MNKFVVVAILFVVTPLAYFSRSSLRPDVAKNEIIVKPYKLKGADSANQSAIGELKTRSSETGRAKGLTRGRKIPVNPRLSHQAVSVNQLKDLLKQSIQSDKFKTPDKYNVSHFENLFLKTMVLRSAPRRFQDLVAEWKNEGWTLDRWSVEGQNFISLKESSTREQGRGFYVIRCQAKSTHVLQTPHRFFDEGTGVIARKLFEECDFLAASWNTVHRKQYDVAHQKNHFINAFTRALLRYNEQTVFVQLHGFDESKMDAGVDVIISNGSKFPCRYALSSAIRLKENFGVDSVCLYPKETNRLGGTTNVQGRLIREEGRIGFLHIEMSGRLRDQLRKSSSLRSKLADSLAVPLAETR